MFWEFPLSIQTLNTTTNQVGLKVFETKEEFTLYVKAQFKLPGQYNLKHTIRWQDAGQQYTKTVTKPNFDGGYYTRAIRGTYQWKKHFREEKERVLNGIIIDDIYVPPFYYWYLNYCPIYDDIKKKKRFGDVWDSDLWFFHYVMLAMLLGKHVCVVKARQRGYSFKIMALLYWCYSWKEGSINTIGASKDEYTLKSWRFAEFYKQHIDANTAWKRGPIVTKSQEWYERTYLKKGGYTGLDSKLGATTFKVAPENGVGGNQTIFFYEEAGIAPTLLKTVGYVRPSLEKGATTTGLIIVSGAIGDLKDCEDIKEIFYNPLAHNFLAVENIWDDDDNKGKDCGLFISEAYNLSGFIDDDGNSLVEEAIAFATANNEKVKTLKRKELAQLDISQKPLSPKEAFAERKHSEWQIDELRKQQERIKLKDKEKKWKFAPFKCLLDENDDGSIKFITTGLPDEHRYPINPEWEDKRGCVTFYEPPPKILPKWYDYFGGVDNVEVDITYTSKSIMAVDIYSRMRKIVYFDKGKKRVRIEGGRIVATYRGRFDNIELGNRQAWLLIKLFNAFTWVERSKPNFINFMKRMGKAEQYLAKESDVKIVSDINFDNPTSSSNYGFHLPSKDDADDKKSKASQTWRMMKASVKEYFQTEFGRVENEKTGELIKVFTGIDMTDDYWTLEEYCQDNGKKNTDRMISHSAAITIGKVYENQLGIPVSEEVKKKKDEPLPIISKPSQSMLGMSNRRRINTLDGGKRRSML